MKPTPADTQELALRRAVMLAQDNWIAARDADPKQLGYFNRYREAQDNLTSHPGHPIITALATRT